MFLRPEANQTARLHVAVLFTCIVTSLAHAQEAPRAPTARTAASRSDEARPDRAFAPAMEQSHERGVQVESDPVALRAELAYNAAMDVASAEVVLAARLEQARREAPFDLAWGFEE